MNRSAIRVTAQRLTERVSSSDRQQVRGSALMARKARTRRTRRQRALTQAKAALFPDGLHTSSVRSSFTRTGRVIVRAICMTSSEWVSRVRMCSLSGLMNTCVLCIKRRK